MRVVFMGTPDIAATCLRKVIEERFEIVGVYTKPDRPKNRGMKLELSDVKKVALEANLPVYQPENYREDAVVEELRALQPDVIAVVAYGRILPQRVLDIPKLGCINIHASILPKLRGSGPVQWAILNGERETGVTAMYMAAEMDAGDIIEIRRTPIEPTENAQSLLDRLAQIGAELLCDTLRGAEAGTLSRTPQNHEEATYAPMLTKELCPVDWSKGPEEIGNHVRGLDPWPVATTEIKGKRFKIYQVERTELTTDEAPGTPIEVDRKGLLMACGQGQVIRVLQLQADGGKRMAAPDYFRGHPL